MTRERRREKKRRSICCVGRVLRRCGRVFKSEVNAGEEREILSHKDLWYVTDKDHPPPTVISLYLQ